MRPDYFVDIDLDEMPALPLAHVPNPLTGRCVRCEAFSDWTGQFFGTCEPMQEAD